METLEIGQRPRFLWPKFLETLRGRLAPSRAGHRSGLLLGSVTLLVLLQFVELIVAASAPTSAVGAHRVFWLLVATTTFSIALLLLSTRVQISREAARSDALAEYINDGLLFIEGESIASANPLARRLLLSEEPRRLTPEISEVLRQARKSSTPVIYEPVLDGRQCHFLVSKVNLLCEDDARLGREMFVFQDVTFLRENEEAKVNFIGALSHEIKTPITSLAMALAMLERTGYDPELVRIANADVGRLRILLDDLLNVSKLKIVRNPNSLQKRDTNLTALLQQTLKTAAALAEQKGVRVTQDIQRGQCLANIDATKITWVLSTLLTDAIRQTPEGQAVDIKLRHEGNQATFEVTYRRRFDSLGPTGHAIVRDIVEAHAGRFISLHLADHESVFRFSLHAYVNGARSIRGMGKNEANSTG